MKAKAQAILLNKYKPRWVVYDYKQQENLDNIDIFATLVKLVFYKVIFRISVKSSLIIRHINIVTLFLYEILDETIYIIQPTLLKVKRLQNLIFLLQKTL